MKLESIFSNRLIRLVIPVLLFLILTPLLKKALLGNYEKDRNLRSCNQEEHAKQETIEGVVVEKYLNTRRLSRLKYSTGVDTVDTELFVFANSKAYDFIKVGDTLIKNAGELDLRIKRKTMDTVVMLDYGCRN